MTRVKGDGTFWLRRKVIYVTGNIDGVNYRKSTGKKITPTTKQWMKHADPLKVLRDILNKEKDKEGIDTSNFTAFGLEVLNMTSSRRNEDTQKDLVRIFNKRIVPYFKHFKFKDIKPMDVVRFLEIQKQEVSNDRVRRVKNLLGLILGFAEDNELIDKNPVNSKTVSQVDLSYTPRNTKTYTGEEIALILCAALGWLKVFLDISFKHGLRTGEAMGLKWEDIDLETGKLHLKRSITRGKITEQSENDKSNKQHFRVIQLLPSTLELLKQYYDVRPSNEWLFINKDGRYFRESKTIVDYHLKPLLKSINVEYKTLYATRRSYASIMKFGGEDLIEIQKVMGHSEGSKITEKHYIDPRLAKLEIEQAKAKKQEEVFDLMVNRQNNSVY